MCAKTKPVRSSSKFSRAAFVIAAVQAFSSLAFAGPIESISSSMGWREIGPWRGGRSTAVSGVYDRPDEFYMGTTGGGIWKTFDAGQTWQPMTDKFFKKSGSVGSIAVCKSSTNVVYAGMGEAAPRGNITHGDGVWKSTDEGITWTHVGLEETQYTGMVRVHPVDPDIAYVASIGPIYKRSKERGLFKTTNGGKTWEKILYADDKTGCVDVVIDPNDPETLYASMWEIWRTPFYMNSGGEKCGLWKSTDGGKTWKELSRNKGLPQEGLLGKICVDVSPVDSKRVWAMVEHATQGGLYRSDDAGETWTLANSSADIKQRPWYFSRVIADPKNLAQVYVCNVLNYRVVENGARAIPFVAGHVDNHDMWIDPSDPKRIASANDGGVAVSVDGGQVWSEQDFPTAQFYHVSADNNIPYRLLGCQQDNSSVRILSRSFTGQLDKTSWTPSAGGESGYIVADPLNPDIVFGANYAGYLEKRNHALNTSREISVWPEEITGQAIAEVRHRFQWTFPIVTSKHNPKRMYVTSQHVLVSEDQGETWNVISPDLTTNDKSKQVSSGGPITKDNTGVEVYCTVFTLAESQFSPETLWAGSDDGLVHITRNGGKSWTNVTPSEMPKDGLCSMIEASNSDPGMAILAVDNHENGDHAPYIFVTNDFGKTWKNKVSGLPKDVFVRVVRQDTVNPNLWFAGTEAGVYFSINAGESWMRLQNNLPVVPIHDLILKNDDVCVATHGRSFWIMDRISPLRALTPTMKDEATILPSFGSGVQYPAGMATQGTSRNPMGGLLIDYYLPTQAEKVELTVQDAKGVVLGRAVSASNRVGLNRTQIQLRYAATATTGVRMWGGGPSTLRVPPGEYSVKLALDGKVIEGKVTWQKDPRTTASDADLVEQYRFSRQISDRLQNAMDLLGATRKAKERLTTLSKGLKETPPEVAKATAFVKEVEEALDQVNAKSGQDFLNYPVKLINKIASLLGTAQGGPYRPTSGMYEVFVMLDAQLMDLEAKWKKGQVDVIYPALEKLRKKD